jgi:PAS domain S-box-containing protein
MHRHDNSEDPALGLAGAVIASSTAPLVLLDGDLDVIAASMSFCEHFGIDPASVQGRQLFALGAGEWDVPQLRSLLESTAAGDAQIAAYEMDLKGEEGSRRLVLNAQRLAYGDTGQIRLLLAVTDVTEARLSEKLRSDALREKDDLLREKAILLQEIQHRVANSLQIIASVLLQTARRANSEETRTHLRDAHNRVMSVAALQQQLAASTLGEVALRAYFTKLCQSIGASMIHDHEQLSLEVSVDDSAVGADASISLGLIVTELVINALKHAFPNGRRGTITVGYRSDGSDWTLSVCDNGVGMPANTASATPGLGTSIINALAAQQRARIDVVDTAPGTTVSVIHTDITAADRAASLGEAPAAV